MKKLAFFILATCCLAAALPAARPRVQRSAIRAIESMLDESLMHDLPDGRIDVIGATRGVYLDGYGIVFSTEVNLWEKAVVTPFHPKWGKEELVVARKRKMERLPLLRDSMRKALFNSATTIDTLPPNELVVISANIAYFSWEDSAGMPTQIIMKAPKHSLQDLSFGRGDKQKLEADIQVQEY